MTHTISSTVLLKRLNRRLPNGESVKALRGKHAAPTWLRTVNGSGEQVLDRATLLELAREYGALSHGETLTYERGKLGGDNTHIDDFAVTLINLTSDLDESSQVEIIDLAVKVAPVLAHTAAVQNLIHQAA
jgi:hypothetical protein